jgi:hypothetical protein
VVDPDAKVLEVAAVMARSRSALGRRRAEPAADRGHHAGLDARPVAQHVSATAWAAIAVFSVAYALIATEKVHRVMVNAVNHLLGVSPSTVWWSPS